MRGRVLPAAAALLCAAVVSAVVLLIAGHNPGRALVAMVGQLGEGNTAVDVVNTAAVYYLAGVAMSVAFAMELFNIGVEGQYRVAAAVAAVVGGGLTLPRPLGAMVIIAAAVAAGAVWALIPALLKVFRGVHEVISTIMLNAIALGVVAYLIRPDVFGVLTGNNLGTRAIPESSWMPANWGIALVVVVGVAYWVMLERSRFGFELRAVGESATAATAGGIDTRRATVVAMLISGGVAGLVAIPELLGRDHMYMMTATTGYGFTGIAVALIGRGHPIGIALGALLWAFLDRSAVALDGVGIPREIVLIMQGVIVLAVVIAYRVAGRREITRQQRLVGAA